MATYTIILIATLMFTQAMCRPEVRRNTITSGSTVNPPPASLSYNELRFILQARNGVEVPTPQNLSPCARAILGCCKNNQMNESCSESLKCGAFFFDDNPCDEKFIMDALKAAKSFYQQFKETT
ncbi:hypothetical protein PYW08_001616 [Mythimna loreyi]|uniref:Uncharacterized protein n=1 Tax=Mythimna loreyi TaxID=667449 RepID=A0ACC2R532_9NEOP|nr:hypothetical protein PYW08_001616 [Mythimna loreyi]